MVAALVMAKVLRCNLLALKAALLGLYAFILPLVYIHYTLVNSPILRMIMLQPIDPSLSDVFSADVVTPLVVAALVYFIGAVMTFATPLGSTLMAFGLVGTYIEIRDTIGQHYSTVTEWGPALVVGTVAVVVAAVSMVFPLSLGILSGRIGIRWRGWELRERMLTWGAHRN